MTAPTATVFGGSGFLGHAVVQTLAKRGYIVRVPTRDPEKAKDLKLMGAVGQIVPFRVTTRSDAAVALALAGSDVVVNLIGGAFEKSKNAFQTIHVETAARIARLAHADGARHLIHVSSLGANKGAKDEYSRTKALGEEAVRAFFPDAVILRPSLILGPRSPFLRRFAFWSRFLPFFPFFGDEQTKVQPVYVGDVAKAILAATERLDARGRIFEIGGPQIYTLREFVLFLLEKLGRRRILVFFPGFSGGSGTFQRDSIVSQLPPFGTLKDLGLLPRSGG